MDAEFWTPEDQAFCKRRVIGGVEGRDEDSLPLPRIQRGLGLPGLDGDPRKFLVPLAQCDIARSLRCVGGCGYLHHYRLVVAVGVPCCGDE